MHKTNVKSTRNPRKKEYGQVVSIYNVEVFPPLKCNQIFRYEIPPLYLISWVSFIISLVKKKLRGVCFYGHLHHLACIRTTPPVYNFILKFPFPVYKCLIRWNWGILLCINMKFDSTKFLLQICINLIACCRGYFMSDRIHQYGHRQTRKQWPW